jgi:hypothetical protein
MHHLLPGARVGVGAALAVLALACAGLLVALGTKEETRLLQGYRT